MPAILLVIMLVSVACSLTLPPVGKVERLPGLAHAFQETLGDEVYSPEDTARALFEFVLQWDLLLGSDAQVHGAIEEMRVHWCPPGYLDGVYGLTMSSTDVWASTRGPIHRTALAHELVHAALWASTGEPDPDHADDVLAETWGPEHDALILGVNAALRGAP